MIQPHRPFRAETRSISWTYLSVVGPSIKAKRSLVYIINIQIIAFEEQNLVNGGKIAEVGLGPGKNVPIDHVDVGQGTIKPENSKE